MIHSGCETLGASTDDGQLACPRGQQPGCAQTAELWPPGRAGAGAGQRRLLGATEEADGSEAATGSCCSAATACQSPPLPSFPASSPKMSAGRSMSRGLLVYPNGRHRRAPATHDLPQQRHLF